LSSRGTVTRKGTLKVCFKVSPVETLLGVREYSQGTLAIGHGERMPLPFLDEVLGFELRAYTLSLSTTPFL
jgi:hypothetical protein